jgi:hypothetical protein
MLLLIVISSGTKNNRGAIEFTIAPDDRRADQF